MDKNIRARLDCTPKYIAAISEWDSEGERISNFEVVKYSDLVRLLEDIEGCVPDNDLKKRFDELAAEYDEALKKNKKLIEEYDAYRVATEKGRITADDIIDNLRKELDRCKLIIHCINELLEVNLIEV